MKQINPNIYPKGGYSFRDTDGTTHSAQTWAGVIARVRAYRQRQGRSNDTTHTEVITQACQKHPNLCSEDNGVTPQKYKEASTKGRVVAWLMAVVKKKETEGLRFVPDGLHAARMDVCCRCPLDKSMPSGCGACTAALKELSSRILDRRTADTRVLACPKSGEYIPVTTWLDLPALENTGYPWECWRKRSV